MIHTSAEREFVLPKIEHDLIASPSILARHPHSFGVSVPAPGVAAKTGHTTVDAMNVSTTTVAGKRTMCFAALVPTELNA